MDDIMNDPIVRNLKSAIPGAENAKSLKDLVGAMAGEKQDYKKMYEDSGTLEALRSQAAGATRQEKEAVTSQKRQELAMAARAKGGGQGLLAGKSRDAAVAGAQVRSTIQQAQVMDQFETENQKKKEEGEKAYNDVLLQIAQKQKDEDDRYRNLVADLSTSFAGLGMVEK